MSMRNFLILALCFCVGILGCKTVDKEELSIELDTYTYESLDYPESTLPIPDSLQNKFIENFFIPWKSPTEALLASLDAFPGKELAYLEKYRNDDAWYGENKKPHKKWLRDEVVNNINTENFPNFLKKGIVISHTNLRRIPTNRPGFDKYSKAGEGYPFDYFQETNLWANTPLLLLHISKDKQWCYVVSSYYKGWVAMHDIAVVDEGFIAQWSKGSFCLPLSDGVNLSNQLSNYAINAKMGMLLPYEEIANKPAKVLVSYANADENQNAQILKAVVAKSSIALPNHEFNEANLKQLVANLVGRPYGWGGNLENRDCSSMIRDLLGTFRIWLPRDSGDQIKLGHKYDFPDKADEKIRLIKEKGIPFFTILRKKGHNMLYVGDDQDGTPLVLHAIWGLKTSYSNKQLANFLGTYPIEGIHKDQDGKLIGRYIIGEAVVTSVLIGAGTNEVTAPVIDEIYAMTNFLEH